MESGFEDTEMTADDASPRLGLLAAHRARSARSHTVLNWRRTSVGMSAATQRENATLTVATYRLNSASNRPPPAVASPVASSGTPIFGTISSRYAYSSRKRFSQTWSVLPSARSRFSSSMSTVMPVKPRSAVTSSSSGAASSAVLGGYVAGLGWIGLTSLTHSLVTGEGNGAKSRMTNDK